MARYKIILAYDGSDFAGSQRQARRRTVQGELEKALKKIGWYGHSILLAGRTDAGVHASGQVAAFDLEWKHEVSELRKALNSNLPVDMAVSEVQFADTNFNPRFDATTRRYRYRLFCSELRDPIREKFAWRVWPAIEGDALFRVAQIFIGRHDFSAFGSPMHSEGNTVRNVICSEWKRDSDHWQYEIQADAFLYRMVRRLVSVQVAVAQGRCLMEVVAHALSESQNKKEIPAGLAPAHGLTLVEVTY